MIDTVHRLGRLTENANKPRGIILQFSSRTYRDAVWKAAKNNPILQERHLRFTEDLCTADRESRAALWPLIQATRREGKVAYYVGGGAYINGKEACRKKKPRGSWSLRQIPFCSDPESVLASDGRIRSEPCLVG
ncbi:hypothetical protein OJAV_G00154480 [Oryzias javanicus]|uniref:Uncharacterized protein n=1 Tax=Oryzias javanicus TaxID=123683 RepID=A0A3S2M8K8_ORYJA|nr:hypothetical protein OJAV_G00154480 [Oryzias javanicus]